MGLGLLSTGVGPIDALIQLVLKIFAVWILVVAGKRLITMFHRNEYAQLIATGIMFLAIEGFLLAPELTVSIIKETFTQFGNQVNTGGGGGAGTGR